MSVIQSLLRLGIVQMMLMPLPSLGAMYGIHLSSLVVGKVEAGCLILVLHHMAPHTDGCHPRLVTGTVTGLM